MRSKKPRLIPGIIPVVSLAVLFSACSIKKPESPSWETTWTIPLITKTYFMNEIIDEIDDSLINVDSLGNPSFRVTRDVDTIEVGNNLTAAGVSQQYRDSLGSVDIDPPAGQSVILTKGALGINDVGGWVPPLSFTDFEDLTDFNEFSWIKVEQGVISLEVTNDLGLRLDTLRITIYNRGDLVNPLGQAVFEDGINQGESLTRSIDLAGDSVSNQLTLKIYGAINQLTFISGGSDNFTAASSFPVSLRASAAQAETPLITKSLDQEIQLENNSIISEATIDSGYLNLHIVNGTRLPMNIELTFPNLTEIDGDTLRVDENIDGNSYIDRQIDLSGYSFVPAGVDTPQTVAILAQATVPASSPQQVIINAADSIAIEAGMTDMVFRTISGIVEPTQITIDSIETDIEVPSDIDNAQLTNATLSLTVYNNSTADIDLDLRIADDTHTREVAISGTAEGKSNLEAPPQATVFNVGSAELSDFLNPAPTRIIISGGSVFNPNREAVTISSDDYFYGEITISSPLAFRLADTTDIDLETDMTEIDQDDMPDIGETFRYGAIRAVLANRLPIGARVSLYLSATADSSVFDNPDAVVVGPFTLESATTDSLGQAIMDIESVFEDSLTAAEIAIFENPVVYITPRVQLLPTVDGSSYFRGSDFISINARATVQVHVGDNIWDNDN